MHVEDLTFEAAIAMAADWRREGYVGISVFHRFDLDQTAAGPEALYTVYAHTPAEYEARRMEMLEPDDPMPPFEILHNYVDDDGQHWGEAIHSADTIEELLQYDPSSPVIPGGI
ncbi:hypothetical protein [Phaeobacter gallaeciensis]|uniref:hypothetical protein n=1 Tax=Phaeobacter gallaeciensis TaxID=60890 RepID=UPI00237FB094|nr:hypothetical protein [Phaeobacter gallaeciensis]MDE4098985.1 hypothetical protein [Phaeobacter gallaeciensis]MDE4107795.1 hypothetical protein [Phaeobacter gallaeciensis]MDE4112249.1 hypothetical protein [Phaeobacter gallaeciensis]MDE4116721.1 hypothetical protein [Phaeobacter gallaeciensis]MDE4121191.1 hypothetical protein [Phaeobacter gallaeciensis]